MRPAWLAIRSAPLGLKQYTHMWASACICTWPKIILTPGGKIEQDTLHANQTTPWGDHGKDYTGWSCPKLADQESGLKLARLESHWSGYAAWSHESCWPVLTTVAVPSLKWHLLLSSGLTNQLWSGSTFKISLTTSLKSSPNPQNRLP